MPPRPAPRPPRQRLAPGGDRLVGQPPLHVLGQRLARAVAATGIRGHRLEADRLQRPVDRRVDGAGRRDVACAGPRAMHLADVALQRRLARSAGSTAWRPGCRRRTRGPEPVQLAPGLLGAHVGRRPQCADPAASRPTRWPNWAASVRSFGPARRSGRWPWPSPSRPPGSRRAGRRSCCPA